MTPKQKLRKLLKESGAVVPGHLAGALHNAPPAKPPPVIETLQFNAKWDVRAVEKMANYFEQRGQLRERYRANGCLHLVVAFTDNLQATAFKQALIEGEFRRN